MRRRLTISLSKAGGLVCSAHILPSLHQYLSDYHDYVTTYRLRRRIAGEKEKKRRIERTFKYVYRFLFLR